MEGSRAAETPIARLEEARQQAIQEVQQVEKALGESPPPYLSYQQKVRRRETLKQRLVDAHARLRLANEAIKQGRRVGQLLLLNGIDCPRNARELVATLYRLFTDTVPPSEQTEDQKIIGRIARDYVQTGVIR